MRQVKTLGLLGTGVIGGGWAARALHFGIDVIAADVKPEMEEWIRGAVADAEILAKEFAPTFSAQDLVSLPNYRIYLKLMIDGVVSRPFSAETLPPEPVFSNT